MSFGRLFFGKHHHTDNRDGAHYSQKTAFIYAFNLIVGVGSLTLPKAFLDSGIVLGSVVLTFMCFLSYIAVTFVVEAEASSNAEMEILEHPQFHHHGSGQDIEMQTASSKTSLDFTHTSGDSTPALVSNATSFADEEDPESRLVSSTPLESPANQNGIGALQRKEEEEHHDNSAHSIFEIEKKTEMIFMADMFLGRIGKTVLSVAIIVYMYGSLAVYAVTVPKSLVAVTGALSPSLSVQQSYYLCLFVFGLFVVPISCFNFQKTKPIQITALVTRNIALVMMIVIGLQYISSGKSVSLSNLKLADFSAIPELYGMVVYAFMCHHSVPGIVTPIEHKNGVERLLGFDFLSAIGSYFVLSLTGVFAYGGETQATCQGPPGTTCTIQPLYSLNFIGFSIRWIANFIALFPVFTLTPSYPLLAITLRNNIMDVVGKKRKFTKLQETLFSILAAAPPILIAFATSDVGLLVGVTGSYAGLIIQFVVPAFLVMYSRRKMSDTLLTEGDNIHKSPFSHPFWVYLILMFSALSFVMNTANHVIRFTRS